MLQNARAGLALLAAAALAVALPAHSQAITGATIRPDGVDAARIVATVTSPRADAIVGGESPAAAMVMAHAVRRRDAHGDLMAPEAIALAAGKPRLLSVHGDHLMMTGLRRPLRPGDRVPLTVRFRSGAAVAVLADVAR